jgi:hypothetical protein
MKYLTTTDVAQQDVIHRAKEYFAEHSRLRVTEETEDSIVFAGQIGMASFRLDRDGGHTNVHVETDRGVGLDVTDIAKRFLHTLGHV